MPLLSFPTRSALAFLLLAAGLPGPASGQNAAPAPTVQGQLDTWFRKAVRAAPGQWGVAVSTEDGRLLWSVNATTSLIPASTVKLFTTGFARTVLGADARQVTRVVGTGYTDPITGTWLGTWALELNGDPTLERPERSGPTLLDLAWQLAGNGIRRLNGPLTVQTGNGMPESSWPSSWASRHRGRRFAPLIGAITLNENLVSFSIAPGEKAGEPPVIMSASPMGVAGLVTIEAETVAGTRDRLRILAAPGGRYRVTGTMGTRARVRYFAGPAREPRAVLEAAWGHALGLAGIRWEPGPGIASPGSQVGQVTLAEAVSAPFDSIAADINLRSSNLGAESLLLWAGGSTEEGARRLTEHVHAITGEREGVRLVDGSGLSSDDRATAYSFVKYLSRFPATPEGRNFPLLLPANGDGTLKKLRAASLGPGVVRAKTGTLGNVASLVGYLGRREGTMIVSVLYNGGSVYAAKQHQWLLFKTLGAEGTPVMGTAESAEESLGDGPVPPNP